MASLFSSIPQTLFNPLASPGAQVYAEVLLTLFAAAQRNHLPLSRELAQAIVAECLLQPEAITLTDDSVTDSAEVPAAEIEEDPATIRASAVLRYLARCGWLRSEMQSDFSVTFIVPDYAFRILRVFQEIADDEPPPLRGLICAIHDLLQASLREGNADVRLPEAHRQTMHLINGLKELQHNIGLHIEKVLQQHRTSDVLEQVFSTYRTEVVDRAYHQLRTTDHVSRYRPGVIAAVTELERTEQIGQAARRLFERGEEPGIEDASQKLLERIREVRTQFEALDRILQAIDMRHSQFVDSAVRSIELQLAASTTTSGQLHSVLSYLLSEDVSADVETFSEITASLNQLFEIGFVDMESLAPPGRTPEPFEPDAVLTTAPSAKELERERDKTMRQLLRAISRDRVRRFADDLLRDNPRVKGGEIPVKGPEDLPLLIYLRAYGDGSLDYVIEEIEDGDWIEHEGIGFRDFILRKC